MTEEAREALAALAIEDGLTLKMGKTPGGPALGKELEKLIFEERDRRKEQPTLLALAKRNTRDAADRMLGALALAGGNAEEARRLLGPALVRSGPVSERDWRSARDFLGLQATIRERWPQKRGGKDSP